MSSLSAILFFLEVIMEEFLKLYQRNKVLDSKFMNKYINVDSELHKKNCLELLVELGELANESKCFKYWSIKKTNKELVLEEYADCLLMVLYMFNYYGVQDIYSIDCDENDDILVLFNDLIRMCTKFMESEDIEEGYLMKVFNYLLRLGSLLGFSNNEIINACYSKIIKNEERLNSNY